MPQIVDVTVNIPPEVVRALGGSMVRYGWRDLVGGVFSRLWSKLPFHHS